MGVADGAVGEPPRIGVLGGTFDPIHNGHLVIAEEARARLALERVLFIPAQTSPLKIGRQTAEARHRCRMLALAIAGNPAFEISRTDLERPGPSYTVDMLRLLRQELPAGAEIYFIMGQDSLVTMPHWRAPEEIVRLCRLVVANRPGYAPDVAGLEQAIPGLREALILLETPELSVSSSELRRRVQMGWPIRYQVPEEVAAYIREQKLYRHGEQAAPALAHPA